MLGHFISNNSVLSLVWHATSPSGKAPNQNRDGVLPNQFHESEQSVLILVSSHQYKVHVLLTQFFSHHLKLP